MRRWLSIVLLLGSSPVGCADESPEPAGVVQAPASGPARFGDPGRVHTYRFTWTSQSRGQGPALLPEELMVTGGLTLSGTLALRVYGEVEGGTLLGVQLQSLDESQLLVFGQDVLNDPDPLLRTEVFVTVEPHHGARQVYFPPDTPPIARELLSGMLGQFDLRVPSHSGVAAPVPSSQGLAQARYERHGAQVHRNLVEALRTDAALPEGSGLPRVQGRSTALLDEHDAIRRIESSDLLVVPSPSEQPALQSETAFFAEREAVYDEDPREMPDLEQLRPRDLWAPPDDTEARRLEAQRYARGLTSFDVSIAVRSMGNGLLPERGFAVRAVGMLRGWPERADDMVRIFDAFPDERSSQLVFDLLASAGTAQSQAVMRELAGREEVEQAPDYPDLVQRFGFIPHPDPQTGAFLLQAHARAVAEQRSESRLAALYPMGSVAHGLREVDPVLAAALVERIRDDLVRAEATEHRVAALAGLGNAADPADLGRILAHTDAENDGIRGMSAVALRKLHDPRATKRLFELLADEEPYVARQALKALSTHPLGQARADRLAAVALVGAHEPELTFELGVAMLSEPGTIELQRAALLAMLDRTRDRETARRLRTWLRELDAPPAAL